MVMESPSAQFELHDPVIDVHLEYSTPIFAVVHHSVTLLCFVKGENVGNPVGTILHRNAPKVSFKHVAGRSGVAVYLRRVLCLSDVCEHCRIGDLVDVALAV